MIVDVSAGNGADATYTVSYSDEHPHPGSIAYKDRGTDPALNTQIILRRVDAGTYLMGSPESELGRSQTGSERQHLVVLTNDFYLGIVPVTSAQYTNVWPGAWTDEYANQQSPLPVQKVNWSEVRGTPCATTDVAADSFLGLLRARTTDGAALPAGYVFDLPTEAQWEYACRAGTETAWNNGTDFSTNSVGVDANLALLGRYSPVGSGGIAACHSKVGRLQPNAWGLYDCHGGVGEIVADNMEYDGAEASPGAVTEPVGGVCTADSYVHRRLRGGCYTYCWAVHMRSAASRHSNQYDNKGKTAEESGTMWHGVRFAFIRPRTGGEWK